MTLFLVLCRSDDRVPDPIDFPPFLKSRSIFDLNPRKKNRMYMIECLYLSRQSSATQPARSLLHAAPRRHSSQTFLFLFYSFQSL